MSLRVILSGAVAGIATAVAFAALHELIISDIWFSLAPMMVAGGLCGGSLAWTYDLLFPTASGSTWSLFVGLQIALLLTLGVASVWMFDPVTPMAVLIAANEPPNELIAQAMPLTFGFIVVAAAVISLLWGRTFRKFASGLVSTAILFLLLGLNVSVLGLVEMSGDAVPLLAEFFALLVGILGAFGVLFFILERRRLFASSVDDAPERRSIGPLA